MATKQVAKQEEQFPVTFEDQRPDYIPEDSSMGQEGVGTDDITIPRIAVLQDLSPQIKKTKPEYIEGAEVGQFFNNVTGELYGTSFVIVPVFFRKEWIIWKDRDAGGGFRGAYSSMTEAQAAMNVLDDAAQCDIKDTAQHFVLVVKPESTMENPVVEEAVISLSGGTMAASRQLNSMVKMAGRDRFSKAYSVSSVEVNGAKGDYQSFKFHPLGYVNEVLYNVGLQMYKAIKAGERDVNRQTDASVEEAVAAEEF